MTAVHARGGSSGSRSGPAERYGLRLALLASALTVAAVAFATITFNVVDDGPLIAWDGSLADSLNAWVHRRPTALWALEAVSWFGRPLVLALVVALTATWCLRQGLNRLSVFLVATTASGAVLGTVVKLIVDRPRPVVDHPVSTAFGKSFPSGHAMHSTITYGAIALVLLPLLTPAGRRALTVLAVAAVAAIGSSRLMLGLHFLTDVVGGYLLGSLWLAAGAAAFRTWRREVPASDTEHDHIGSLDQTAGSSPRRPEVTSWRG